MKEKELNTKMNQLIDLFSKGQITLEEAISDFESLTKQYIDIKKAEGKAKAELLRLFAVKSLMKLECWKELKEEYQRNLEENKMLKEQFGFS